MHSREEVFEAALETIGEFEEKAKDKGISPSHEKVVFGRDAVSTLLYNLGYSQGEFLTWVAEKLNARFDDPSFWRGQR